MSQEVTCLRIFISSPGDVSAERQITLEVIDQLQYEPQFNDNLFLRVVAWDKPGAGPAMLANMTPQDAIYLGLPKPADCDIVVTTESRRQTASPCYEIRGHDACLTSALCQNVQTTQPLPDEPRTDSRLFGDFSRKVRD
jgi:hypothetical protein